MRFAADENFNNTLLKALLAHLPTLDIVRVQDTEAYQFSDPALLEWAAQQGRILLTHDVRTLPAFAFQRVSKSLQMPGVVEVSDQIGIGMALEDLLLLLEAGEESDFTNQVLYIPLS